MVSNPSCTSWGAGVGNGAHKVMLMQEFGHVPVMWHWVALAIYEVLNSCDCMVPIIAKCVSLVGNALLSTQGDTME